MLKRHIVRVPRAPVLTPVVQRSSKEQVEVIGRVFPADQNCFDALCLVLGMGQEAAFAIRSLVVLPFLDAVYLYKGNFNLFMSFLLSGSFSHEMIARQIFALSYLNMVRETLAILDDASEAGFFLTEGLYAVKGFIVAFVALAESYHKKTIDYTAFSKPVYLVPISQGMQVIPTVH